MLKLIIFILVVLSITNIINREYIFDGLHRFLDTYFPNHWFNKMIKCPTCLGFWVGVLCFFLFPIQYEFALLTMFVAGCVSSVCNKLIAIIFYKF